MGIFGDLFDFNRDGHLDPLEKAIEFTSFMNMLDGDNDEENDDESEEDEE